MRPADQSAESAESADRPQHARTSDEALELELMLSTMPQLVVTALHARTEPLLEVVLDLGRAPTAARSCWTPPT